MLEMELEPRLATQLSLFLVIFLIHKCDLHLKFGAKVRSWVGFFFPNMASAMLGTRLIQIVPLLLAGFFGCVFKGIPLLLLQ